MNENKFEIIELDPNRFKEYYDFKLARLIEDPQSSHASYDEEKGIPLELWKQDLEISQAGNSFKHVFAQKDGKLIGMATAFFEKKMNRRHVVNIASVHVDTNSRGMGVGTALLESLENKIQEKPYIIKAELTVNTIQIPAYKLYLSLGYKNTGTLLKTLKVGDNFYDEYIMEKFFSI